MVSRTEGARETYALIIGVNDYGGEADLRGGVADAKAWARLALEMGIPGSNIAVLTSPVLDPGRWSDDPRVASIRFAPATRDAILRAARAIARHMDQPRHSKALVTFSGHGSWDATEGATLVPADGADDPANRLPVSALLAALDERAEGTDVTLFIDACHAGREADEPRARPRTISGDPVPATANGCTPCRPGDIMISATQPQELSHEIEVDGKRRGAFSWAVTSLLDRWGVRSPGLDPDFDIAYSDLLDRTQQILTAMEVIQPPQYKGPDWARGRAVLSSRLADDPDGVPDADDAVREINPVTGWYEIETSAGDIAGGMTVSTSELVWTWDLDKVSGPFPSGLSLTLTKQSGTFYPPSNKLVQTFENFNGLTSSPTTLTPTYKVTASGTSETYYVKYSTANGLEWVAPSPKNIGGNTIEFEDWSGGSVTQPYYRQDDFK